MIKNITNDLNSLIHKSREMVKGLPSILAQKVCAFVKNHKYFLGIMIPTYLGLIATTKYFVDIHEKAYQDLTYIHYMDKITGYGFFCSVVFLAVFRFIAVRAFHYQPQRICWKEARNA